MAPTRQAARAQVKAWRAAHFGALVRPRQGIETRMIVSVDGAELFYTSRGAGHVCLVPSATGTRLYERQMSRQLGDSHRLVFVDLRGGGQSTGDPGALTFDQVAADFEAVRVDLGVDQVSVIGHSILGALAIEYGRRCPETVRHVVTVGTPPRGDMGWLFARATQFFEEDASDERKLLWRENLAKLPTGTPLEQSFPAQAPLRFFDARTDLVASYQDALVKPDLLAHLLGPLTHEWDVTRDASTLGVPILLAHGRYDYTVPYTLWEGIETVLPTARRHLFLRSGHQPFFEEPEEFAMVVAAWMTNDDGRLRAV